jgi:hypothetical protein
MKKNKKCFLLGGLTWFRYIIRRIKEWILLKILTFFRDIDIMKYKPELVGKWIVSMDTDDAIKALEKVAKELDPEALGMGVMPVLKKRLREDEAFLDAIWHLVSERHVRLPAIH